MLEGPRSAAEICRRSAARVGHDGAVNAASFGLGGEAVLRRRHDQGVLLYTLGGAHFSDVINDVCFGGRGGGVLCSAAADGLLYCFNARNSDRLLALGGHTDECLSVAAAPEPGSHQIVTGSADGTVRYWSVDADELM